MESPLFPSHPKWVTERIVAKITGFSVHTLRAWRLQGREITYVKVGRSVRYDLRDVEDFMSARTVRPQG